MTETNTLGTRAVERIIQPGNDVRCKHCDKYVKFAAIKKLRQVIANIYDGDRWDRTEHFHKDCYEEAGKPWGDPTG
jgi:hypothetical protein